MGQNKPEHVFILAAGKGTRLRPHTHTMPKPMVPINGRPILDYCLEKLKIEDVKKITINTSYLGDRIKDYVAECTGLNITLSAEEELLETGGGVKKSLNTMENKDFYLINGDAIWDDPPSKSSLNILADAWNPEIMDILLLLQPVATMTLTRGIGDYNLNENNQAVRSLDQSGAYMFAGIRIVNPRVFDDSPDGAFSFLQLMDKAQEQGRLYGVPHEGMFHHISTPEDLEAVNASMKAGE